MAEKPVEKSSETATCSPGAQSTPLDASVKHPQASRDSWKLWNNISEESDESEESEGLPCWIYVALYRRISPETGRIAFSPDVLCKFPMQMKAGWDGSSGNSRWLERIPEKEKKIPESFFYLKTHKESSKYPMASCEYATTPAALEQWHNRNQLAINSFPETLRKRRRNLIYRRYANEDEPGQNNRNEFLPWGEWRNRRLTHSVPRKEGPEA